MRHEKVCLDQIAFLCGVAGCVQLDVRGSRTHSTRSAEARRAGANGPEAGAGERSRRTGEASAFQGGAGETRASEGFAPEETRATEGGAREETCATKTCATETRVAETRAPKRGAGKAGAATSASTASTCEGRVVRTDGTLPRGHSC